LTGLIKILIKISYPCTVVSATADIGNDGVHTLKLLQTGVNAGWLLNVGRHYAPTPKLIQHWDDMGILEVML
jgi:hypothetical protein